MSGRIAQGEDTETIGEGLGGEVFYGTSSGQWGGVLDAQQGRVQQAKLMNRARAIGGMRRNGGVAESGRRAVHSRAE